MLNPGGSGLPRTPPLLSRYPPRASTNRDIPRPSQPSARSSNRSHTPLPAERCALIGKQKHHRHTAQPPPGAGAPLCAPVGTARARGAVRTPPHGADLP